MRFRKSSVYKKRKKLQARIKYVSNKTKAPEIIVINREIVEARPRYVLSKDAPTCFRNGVPLRYHVRVQPVMHPVLGGVAKDFAASAHSPLKSSFPQEKR